MNRLVFIAGTFFLALSGCEEKDLEKSSLVPEKAVGPETDSKELPVVLPSGWTVETVNGRTYLCGPTFDNHRANINLGIEPFRGTLNEYFDYCEMSLKNVTSDYKHLERTPFQTEGGIDGIRFVHEMTIQGRKMWQTCYALNAPKGEKHVFNCSVVADKGRELAPIFDQIIRTYKP